MWFIPVVLWVADDNIFYLFLLAELSSLFVSTINIKCLYFSAKSLQWLILEEPYNFA